MAVELEETEEAELILDLTGSQLRSWDGIGLTPRLTVRGLPSIIK